MTSNVFTNQDTFKTAGKDFTTEDSRNASPVLELDPKKHPLSYFRPPNYINGIELSLVDESDYNPPVKEKEDIQKQISDPDNTQKKKITKIEIQREIAVNKNRGSEYGEVPTSAKQKLSKDEINRIR